jgi:hypothetical protein
MVRTNSEAITAVFHPPDADMTDGTANSSDFLPDKRTHATQNRFDRGYRFMHWMTVPMTDGAHRRKRAMRTLAAVLRRPGLMRSHWTCREWEKRISVFTVMQDLDNHKVHGYLGLFVVDGSSIPANIGVNPSLTIAAMAEAVDVSNEPPRRLLDRPIQDVAVVFQHRLIGLTNQG